MERPRSIVIFDYCYLGAWLIGVVNLALTWNSRIEQANSAAAQSGAAMPGSIAAFLVAGLVVGAAITLTLWYFVARRGAVVAKWIVVALFAIGVLSLLTTVVRGAVTPGIGGVLTVVAWVAQAVAVVMLFRPDAVAWFARRSGTIA